jgi:hypothetical protein
MDELPNELTINGAQYVRADADCAADVFLSLDGDQQAHFLHVVARESLRWKHGRRNQWWEINRHLNGLARSMLQEWAEYFEKAPEPAATIPPGR